MSSAVSYFPLTRDDVLHLANLSDAEVTSGSCRGVVHSASRNGITLRPSSPPRVEVRILNSREPLTEGLEGIPGNRFGLPAHRQALPANSLGQVAEPGRHGNRRGHDVPY